MKQISAFTSRRAQAGLPAPHQQLDATRAKNQQRSEGSTRTSNNVLQNTGSHKIHIPLATRNKSNAQGKQQAWRKTSKIRNLSGKLPAQRYTNTNHRRAAVRPPQHPWVPSRGPGNLTREGSELPVARHSSATRLGQGLLCISALAGEAFETEHRAQRGFSAAVTPFGANEEQVAVRDKTSALHQCPKAAPAASYGCCYNQLLQQRGATGRP
ncbi:hypothetical protein Anapl_17161 [Anas platyrhynchos]|uniref:Uncharacterized protein n=1 Tax=Anas platyrhynchos TaxID=8839 RepID=R0KZZ2_ANAPL|nr:hypothetical protein Anapl_17161 [Anas platyrhynchos]